jgi:hypothetical protein
MRCLLAISIVFLWFAVKGQPLPPGSPAVVITEIFYDMPGVADSLEFIELTNPSDTNERSLTGHSFSQGIVFSFPTGLIVQAGESVVVAKDAGAMFRMFGIDAYQWESGDLDDEGELIVLNNNFDIPVDSVNYQASILWPEASGNGKSIVLCNDTLPNTGPENWSAATTNTGVLVDGTVILANPGIGCSGNIGIEKPADPSFSIYPNPTKGEFQIEFSSEMKGPIQVIVYNLIGNVMLQESVYASGNKLNLETELSDGVYLLYLETAANRFVQQLVIME